LATRGKDSIIGIDIQGGMWYNLIMMKGIYEGIGIILGITVACLLLWGLVAGLDFILNILKGV
jgi:hypothetical protein